MYLLRERLVDLIDGVKEALSEFFRSRIISFVQFINEIGNGYRSKRK